jgi:predicted XRE-type DNA-binding protein
MEESICLPCAGGNKWKRVSFEELAGSDDTQKKELEENILSLHESGMKQQEIAIQLGTSQSKVSRVIKKSEK